MTNPTTLRHLAEDTLARYAGRDRSIEATRLADLAEGTLALLNEAENVQRQMRDLTSALRIVEATGDMDRGRALLAHIRDRKPREDRTAGSPRG